ncbi:hypothetical protein [Eubacterium ruminantium]|uniref:Uncharacterized protein n=2 Tax=Eubacterium TaxID=1730 RepID=A0A1T4K713_9FIRM|nr:hypothetical protein [Eubacterium ruminantium]SCW27292.1 hypothetical protein SAMN05660484_00127 [Eubacterium ruminantium]SDM15387.1 hypothetical protein SAMN04490370_101216 [Eubacterium ruminantium]SJZ38095.1 hypothetical protein SAMN02745110_00203 [Eubacterium ruminantium]
MGIDCKAPQKVDVICQHSVDGTVIPLRIRLTDEDGQRQVFNIKEYMDISHKGSYTTADGVFVTDNNLIFECKILVINMIKKITLYYSPFNQSWTMTG